MSRGKRNNDDAVIGCIAAVLLGIFLMPFVGFYLVCSKDPEKKNLGWVLLIVGIVLFIVFAIASA